MRLRTLVSLALWFAIVYFFFLVLRNLDWNSVATRHIAWPLALFALAAGVGNRFFLPLIWTTVLSSLEGRRMPVRPLIWPYAESWIARYLPGKVGLIGARVLAADRYGYSKVNAIISGAVEVVVQVIFMTVNTIVLLSLGLRSRLPFNVVPVVAAASLLALMISPPVLRRLVDVYLRVHKNAAAISYLSWGAVIRCVLVCLAMYICQSFYSTVMAESIGLAARSQLLVFLGALFLSSIAGMVAFFAPGGLGVRELVFVQVLGPWFPKEQLVSFVLFWRLVETLADGLFVAAAWWVSGRIRTSDDRPRMSSRR